MYNTQNYQAALSHIQNKQIREQFDRSGFYRATVVSNDDPLLLGRVKVRIPALHGSDPNQTGYMDDGMLPYAFPGTIAGAGYEEGQYLLPSVGHVVWVSFETGTDNLIYFGGLYSQSPNGDKYIYKGRDVNNGAPILVAGNDLPTDYDPNKHVLYRTVFGDIIYIDERVNRESIIIESRYGCKIALEKDGVSIVSNAPLSANFPYSHIVYCSSSLVDGLEFTVPTAEAFKDPAMLEKEEMFYNNSLVLFIHSNQIKHTGLITAHSTNVLTVKLIG